MPGAETDFTVTLLGSGTPVPSLDRFGPCTMVEAGGRKFLFDAGRGAMQRLHQLGITFADISGIFLTHHHSDHMVDLVDLAAPLGRAGGAGPAEEGRNVDHVALRIEPFDGDALLAWLRSEGIEPGEVESRYGAEGDGPSIYIRDPEGNVVELKGPPWETGA